MNRRLMTRHTLYRRLRDDGWDVSDRTLDRYIPRVLNEPDTHRPTGGAGHRVYTEHDYRLIVSYLRVLKLCGADQTHPTDHTSLHRSVARCLTDARRGYIYIVDGIIHWSGDVPVDAIRGGVATCWPVWD